MDDASSRTRVTQLLLELGGSLSLAPDLASALSTVASWLVTALGIAFCQISTLDRSGQSLIVRASARAWKGASPADVGRQLDLERVPSFREVVQVARPLLLRRDGPEMNRALEELRVATGESAHSALLLPLSGTQGAIGVVALGERRNWDRSPITAEKMSIGQAVADSAALALERGRRQGALAAASATTPVSQMVSPLSVDLEEAAQVLPRALPEQDVLLRRLQVECRRFSNYLEDVLNVLLLESGAVSMSLEPLPVVPLLRRAVAIVQATTDRHEFELDLSARGSLVLADGDRIETALSNLLLKAIDSSPDGGAIVVREWEQSGEVVISVQDAGGGLPAAEVARLFDRFHYGYSDELRTAHGHGLVLPMARSIVEQHHGRIWAECESGKGTRLCLALPTFTAPDEV